MSLHDPISILLTKIRNAAKVHIAILTVSYSNLRKEIIDILLKEGYIANYEIVGQKFKAIKITLKYKNRTSALNGIKQISKPGLRVYSDVDNMPKVFNGLGIAIISTSKGLLTDKQARVAKVGGEVIAYVW